MMANPPTRAARPSTSTARPGPSQAVRPAVRSAPNGSVPRKAAAQIAIARARISSVLIDWTTTVESPMKTTPLRPPRNASRNERALEWETPIAAIAIAVRKKPASAGSPLFGRPESASSASEPTTEPRPMSENSSPSVPGPP